MYNMFDMVETCEQRQVSTTQQSHAFSGILSTRQHIAQKIIPLRTDIHDVKARVKEFLQPVNRMLQDIECREVTFEFGKECSIVRGTLGVWVEPSIIVDFFAEFPAEDYALQGYVSLSDPSFSVLPYGASRTTEGLYSCDICGSDMCNALYLVEHTQDTMSQTLGVCLSCVTDTSKAFIKAIELVQLPKYNNCLFWDTPSGSPGAEYTSEEVIAASLQALEKTQHKIRLHTPVGNVVYALDYAIGYLRDDQALRVGPALVLKEYLIGLADCTDQVSALVRKLCRYVLAQAANEHDVFYIIEGIMDLYVRAKHREGLLYRRKQSHHRFPVGQRIQIDAVLLDAQEHGSRRIFYLFMDAQGAFYVYIGSSNLDVPLHACIRLAATVKYNYTSAGKVKLTSLSRLHVQERIPVAMCMECRQKYFTQEDVSHYEKCPLCGAHRRLNW